MRLKKQNGENRFKLFILEEQTEFCNEMFLILVRHVCVSDD